MLTIKSSVVVVGFGQMCIKSSVKFMDFLALIPFLVGIPLYFVLTTN